MNLTEAQTEIKARGFDYLATARLTFMLNNAKNELEDYWSWPWLDKVIAGPSPLTIPDFKTMQSVQLGSSQELLYADARQIAAMDADLAAVGIPTYWWLEGPNPYTILHTWPTQSGAIVNALYTCESPELASSAATPLIPTRYHPLWIDLAVVEAYKDSDNFAAANALRADVQGRLYDLIARYEVRNRQHSYFNTQRTASGDD